MQTLFRRMRAPEAEPAWGLLTALIMTALVFVFMSIVGVTIGAALFPSDADAAITAGWLAGGLLALGAVFLGLRGRTDDLRLGEGFPALIAFGVGLGTAVTLDLIGIPITGRVIEPPELARVTVGGGAFLWLAGGLFVLVVQPIVEEVVFRGVLYPALRAAQNVWVAVVISTLLYAFFHQFLYSYPGEISNTWWTTFAEPLAAGLVLGVLRAVTQSTSAAIVAHIGIGVFALLKTLLIVAAVLGG